MKTLSLLELVKVPDEQRDSSWENLFFNSISTCNLKLLLEDPQQGPDGWPYLLAATTEDATEPFQTMLHWLSDKGIGLAINPNKEYPDYVFSYGMLWNFRETGLFFGTANTNAQTIIDIPAGTKVYSGEPTEKHLPKYARAVLKQFFTDQAVLNPRILMVSLDEKNWDMVISTESLGNPPQAEYEGIAEAISWFLPPHYSLALMSEQGLPTFFAL